MSLNVSKKVKKLIWLLPVLVVLIFVHLGLEWLTDYVCDIKGTIVFATIDQSHRPAGVYFYDCETGNVSELKIDGYADLKFAAKYDENSFYCIGTSNRDNKVYALKVLADKVEKNVLLGDNSVSVDALECYNNGILCIADNALYYIDFETSEKQTVSENMTKSDYYGYQLVTHNSTALYCAENSIYLLQDDKKTKLDNVLLKKGDVCLGVFRSDDKVMIKVDESKEEKTQYGSKITPHFSQYNYDISTGKLKKAPFWQMFYTSEDVINDGKTILNNNIDSAFGCWTDIVDVKTGLVKKADYAIWDLSDSAYDMFSTENILPDEVTGLDPDSKRSTEVEDFSKDFPEITEAVLHKNGTEQKLDPDDVRLIKMINYITFSLSEGSAGIVQSPISQTLIDQKISEEKMYLTLTFDVNTTAQFTRYNRGIVVGSDVIMIDDNTEGYYKPYNITFVPYGHETYITPSILESCGF